MNLIKPASPASSMPARELCTKHGAVLIFDEVMTGFRVGPVARRACTASQPDLTTLGKVIGGGMPVGAFGGGRDHGQAGAARPGVSGRHALRQSGGGRRRAGHPEEDHPRRASTKRSAPRPRAWCAGLVGAAATPASSGLADSVGGMFGVYFSATPPTSYAEVMACDKDMPSTASSTDAARRRLSGAVRLRGRLRLGRAQRRRHRRHHRRGRRVFAKLAP
jgi:glutamate-1-semialdehyde 2,1-aminomutase